ncbi:MAG: DUF4331 domain-containing protein [Candidatus Limnocylindria bacterium]
MRKKHPGARLVIGLITLSLFAMPQASLASSHREAPLIANDPTADNTDLYAFVSPDRPDTVTIVADYIPLEEPAGGPNFSNFDPNVLYEIKVDNTGDAVPDVTYQFRFRTSIRNPATFLYNTGPITSLTDPDWNIRQTYSVTRIDRTGSRLVLGNGVVAPANIGPRSTPNYGTLASGATASMAGGGGKVFAGPRDDPFFVDLGSIFDLGGLRPFNAAHLIPLGTAPGVDGVGGFNTHSIAIQVPKKLLSRNGVAPTSMDASNAVIGVWATASRQSTRVLNLNGTTSNSGPWRQISRLGNPLVNEVIIPVGMKDYWNSQQPKDDRQFEKYYGTGSTPLELAGLVNLLYPSLPNARTTHREDIEQILLQGLPLPGGHNLNSTGPAHADMLRLNMAIAPCTADSATDDTGKCSRLGVLDGDLAGFPNGRRLTDDVTDIELRAIADGYGAFVNSVYKSFTPNNSPNNQVGDGVNQNDRPFLSSFPYVALPNPGYEHMHHPVGSTSTGFLP